MLQFETVLNKCKKYLKIFSFFKSCTNKHDKNITTFSLFIYFKQNKKRLFLLIPENIGDRVSIVCKKKMLTEYKRKRYKVFQELNISNISIFWLTVNQQIPFDEYNNFRHFH